ncbi:MAG: branched-chain amino acid ABC transporter substrate-binding protein [Chloroflexota bacterium]|nr:branched-chain amino acid ABC transporter substrate-binding protein [Dehalococcoidia bacterium]MDW8253700.1 branched-chain amino acid ABC transporter substrate-binding protein [Chloroflexota bacterium]
MIGRRYFLFAAAAAALAACQRGPQFSGEAIVFVVGPLSGEQAEGGQSMLGGARLKAEEVNQAGGVLGGRRVAVRPLNDEADEAAAVEAAKQVAAAVQAGQTVLGVIGHYNSGPTAAALPIYRDLGLVVVTPSASNPALSRAGVETFFRVCATDATQGPRAARYLVERGWRRVALVYTTNTYGQGLAAEFASGLQQAGGQLAAAIALRPDAPSFAEQLPALRGAAAQAIFFAGDFPDGITFVREARRAGITTPILASDANFVDQFIDELGALAEGILISTITPDPRVVASPAWFAAFRQLEQRNPGIDATTGYSAMEVLLTGVQRANRADGRAIASAIRSLDIQSLVGRIQYDANGDLLEQRVFFYIVEGGRFRQLTS